MSDVTKARELIDAHRSKGTSKKVKIKKNNNTILYVLGGICLIPLFVWIVILYVNRHSTQVASHDNDTAARGAVVGIDFNSPKQRHEEGGRLDPPSVTPRPTSSQRQPRTVPPSSTGTAARAVSDSPENIPRPGRVSVNGVFGDGNLDGAQASGSGRGSGSGLLSASNINQGAISYNQHNDQSGKIAFAQSSAPSAAVALQNPENVVRATTIISAVLETAINTDLPGPIKAVVTESVYDSISGRNLLIPAGSFLMASYSSAISQQQSRVQIGWQRLVRPDQYSVNLGNAAGVDARGAAGVQAQTDYNLLAYLGSFALSTTLAIGNTWLDNQVNGDYVVSDATAAAVNNGRSFGNQLGNQLLSSIANTQPSLRIPAGTIVMIYVHDDIQMPTFDGPRPLINSIR
jgi:type IV secretory pathway VirB10-like protein